MTVLKKFSGSELVHGRATLATSVLLIMTSEACADFTGPVISVLNRDIIAVLHHKKAEHIRLQGIDCPEKAEMCRLGRRETEVGRIRSGLMTRVLIEDTGQLAPGAVNLLFTGSSTKRSLMPVRSNPHLARREVSYGSLSQPISELTPVASQPSCESSSAVHFGSHLCACLQLFRDTTMALAGC